MTDEESKIYQALLQLPVEAVVDLAKELGVPISVKDGVIEDKENALGKMATGRCQGCNKN